MLGAVQSLFIRGRYAQRPNASHRVRRLSRDLVDLVERQLIETACARTPKFRDRIMIKIGGAGEQKAAIAPGGARRHGAGIDTDNAGRRHASIEQRSDARETGAAEANHAHLGIDRSREAGECRLSLS